MLSYRVLVVCFVRNQHLLCISPGTQATYEACTIQSWKQFCRIQQKEIFHNQIIEFSKNFSNALGTDGVYQEGCRSHYPTDKECIMLLWSIEILLGTISSPQKCLHKERTLYFIKNSDPARHILKMPITAFALTFFLHKVFCLHSWWMQIISNC